VSRPALSQQVQIPPSRYASFRTMIQRLAWAAIRTEPRPHRGLYQRRYLRNQVRIGPSFEIIQI
jgi:hypothetical protein